MNVVAETKFLREVVLLKHAGWFGGIKALRGTHGMLWSEVASVQSGRLTDLPAFRLSEC